MYEATQGPLLPAEIPSLNPTGGVTPKPQINLEYQKDPTRSGGGVFIAKAPREDVIKDLPAGMVITPEESREGLSSTSPQYQYLILGPGAHSPPSKDQQQQQSLASMVNFTPLTKSSDTYGNVNPAMNAQAQGNVQVMNVLDGSQGINLAAYEISDGFLEGLPGTMFDWRE